MARTDSQHVASRGDYRELSRILSYESLLTLALLVRYRRLTRNRLAEVLGMSAQDVDDRLGTLERLAVIRRKQDAFEIRTKGRRIAAALELYRFQFGSPEESLTAHLSDSKRKRLLNVNDFYFPEDTDVS